MFERETRREKILDSRHREMKLKERTKSQQDGKVGLFSGAYIFFLQNSNPSAFCSDGMTKWTCLQGLCYGKMTCPPLPPPHALMEWQAGFVLVFVFLQDSKITFPSMFVFIRVNKVGFPRIYVVTWRQVF